MLMTTIGIGRRDQQPKLTPTTKGFSDEPDRAVAGVHRRRGGSDCHTQGLEHLQVTPRGATTGRDRHGYW
jgi:hypothetical protein